MLILSDWSLICSQPLVSTQIFWSWAKIFKKEHLVPGRICDINKKEKKNNNICIVKQQLYLWKTASSKTSELDTEKLCIYNGNQSRWTK